MRIYELAREAGVTSVEVLKAAEAAGLEATNAISSIEDGEAAELNAKFFAEQRAKLERHLAIAKAAAEGQTVTIEPPSAPVEPPKPAKKAPEAAKAEAAAKPAEAPKAAPAKPAPVPAPKPRRPPSCMWMVRSIPFPIPCFWHRASFWILPCSPRSLLI